ncbi:two-partner secretion domain-containing protein [Calothrix sp. 336/3]|uniref:two-partner secretion domain-containing protein n=1 Tax=Calothrix sp. 336/3 TaxID=1337936 RepID=UPI0004E364E1|nr:S-layer family protein [Calothrix sp. 336/3]AKG20329.1 filamentous hemagglutinin family outer membrane protein [Calothrix sp. 336/3]
MMGITIENNWKTNIFASILTTAFLTSGMISPVVAQVASDGTTKTIVNPNSNIFTIINGTAKGNNLFHSFSNFSVPTGREARFDLVNTPNITNIFSRVTGGNISNIDGLIKTINNNPNNAVSLFLMNPNGIIFGQNAKLDISGSFVGTTANSINFADGVEFSAVNATANPLLTMSVPVGLQLGANAGPIQVQGTDLRVTTGQTLAFVGSQINMTGAKLRASDGQVQLWALGNAQIQIDNQGGWKLTSPTANWGTITLQQASLVDASGMNGGAINIRGRGLTVQDGSNISSITFKGQGKGITVQTTDFVDLMGASLPGQAGPGIGTNVGSFFGPPATGRAGDVTVETGHLRLLNGAWLQSSSSGNNSRSGDVTVRASNVEVVGVNPFLNMPTSITTTLFSGKNNESGKITVEANLIRVRDGGIISTALVPINPAFSPTGKAGDISIKATESLEISGYTPYKLLSGVSTGIGPTKGDGGNISIDVGRLQIFNGGTIRSTLSGKGKAGNITIKAQEIEVSDPEIDYSSKLPGGITVSTGNNSVGTGGNITLTADKLRLFNGGQISSSTQGKVSAGNINLQVKNIDVQGISKPLSNGKILPSSITASSTTKFAAGSVNIIQSETVSVRDGAKITVSNIGTGDAGNLNITAHKLFLDYGASLEAEVNGGNQGNIYLQLRDALLLRHGSNIATSATDNSTGGNITINSPVIVGLENSNIIANAFKGKGGNINITTEGIIGLEFRDTLTPRTDLSNDITASSQFNLNGNVEINNVGVDPNSGLIELPANLSDSSQQITSGCDVNQGSSFVATGRGGIPQNPSQELRSDTYGGLYSLRPWSDTRDISTYRKAQPAQTKILPSPETLVQATSWRRNSQGKVELVAAKSSTPVPTLSCSAITK